MSAAPYQQQSGEPDKWFARFEKYRLQGEGRSLESVYREEIEASRSKVQRSARPNSQWYAISKQWQWAKRAAAWDSGEVKQTEAVLRSVRSELVDRRAVQESEFAAREARMRERAYLWMEDYLFGRVVESRTTEKEADDPEGGLLKTKTIVTIPKAPPQWVIQRLVGTASHEKHLAVLYGLTQQIMQLPGESDELRAIKQMIQAALEGLLLEVGATEMRAMLAIARVGEACLAAQ